MSHRTLRRASTDSKVYPATICESLADRETIQQRSHSPDTRAQPHASTVPRNLIGTALLSRRFSTTLKRKIERRASSPEDFATAWNERERCTKEKFGVIFTSGRRPVMLGYDSRTVLRGLGPWRVLCSAAIHSTVFALTSPLKLLCSLVISFGIFISMSRACTTPDGRDAYDVDELAAIMEFFNSLLTFLLALYVTRSVARWWEMRQCAVGGLWDAIGCMSMWAAAWWDSGSEQDAAARALVLRYGLVLHSLLFKEARGELSVSVSPSDAGLDELIKSRLLKPAEARTLAPLPSKAYVVLTWLTAFWTKVFSMSQDTYTESSERQSATMTAKSSATKFKSKMMTPIPHACHMMPIVMGQCAAARNAISAGLSTMANLELAKANQRLLLFELPRNRLPPLRFGSRPRSSRQHPTALCLHASVGNLCVGERHHQFAPSWSHLGAEGP